MMEELIKSIALSAIIAKNAITHAAEFEGGEITNKQYEQVAAEMQREFEDWCKSNNLK